MRVRHLVVLSLTSCVGLPATSTLSTSSSGAEGAAGGDGIFIRDVANMTRVDAEDLLRHDGFTNIVAAGDTDPAFARDELVCGQAPQAGHKVAPSAVVTITYCNTYRAPAKPPALVGLSVEDAKQRVKATGFKHAIQVLTLDEFDQHCKADTVCRVSPDYWQLDQDELVLYVNHTVTISVPN